MTVGRPEKPIDPQAGPVQRLAWQLRQLREQAGSPGYRLLARRAHFSASTLAEAAKGDRLPSREVTLAYAAACGGDPDEWLARWTAAEEALAGQSGPPAQTLEPVPYRGLTAYRAEEAGWFFGRDALVERLLAKVRRVPLVAVLGASGGGKSSLLGAGLIGTLANDPGWRTMLLTPTAQPLEALSGEVAKLSGTDRDRLREELERDPAAADVAIRSALAAGPPGARALLVVDQFEELYTSCTDRAARRRFVDALLDVSHGPDRRTTVVLGVRADFLGHLAQHAELLAALGDDATVLVGPVGGADLREIVTRPAARAGLSVDTDLLATLLADVADEPGTLPLVSHALLATWQRRTGPALTLREYQASGGVRGAIAQTAERVHAGFDDDERQAARRIFVRLTALGDGTEDTRRTISRAELDGIADETVTGRVLTELAEARLIVLGDGTVEVAHEALIRAWPRLHRWLTDDRADLAVHRRLTGAAQTWAALSNDAGALYRGAQLVAARGLAEDRPGELNRLEQAFLRASNVWAEAEQRTARRRARLLRRLVAGVAALLVLALLGGGIAVRQRQDARRQELAALSGELSLRARSLLDTDPELAGLLAVEAARLHPSVESRGSVLSAAAAPRRTELNVGGLPIAAVAFSPSGALLAASANDGTIGLWDPARRVHLGTLPAHRGRAGGIAFTADGSRMVTAGFDGTVGSVAVWDTSTRQEVARFTEEAMTSALAFSPDGSRVAVGAPGGIALHDLRTGRRTVLGGHSAPVASLSFSADGRWLAATDGTGRLWDLNGAPTPVDLPGGPVAVLAFATTGTVLAGSAETDGVRLWDVGSGTPRLLPPLPVDGRTAWTISAPSAGRLAVADENGAITVWDLGTRLPLRTFQDRGRTETVSVALSADGTMLASAGFNGTIVVRDLTAAAFGGATAPVRDLAVSPDGTAVAAAGSDGVVRLWHADGRSLGALTGHPDEVAAVAYDTTGRQLAAVTRTSVVTVWDVARGVHAAPPFAARPSGPSTDIAFAPDGGLLATATFAPVVWDVRHLDRPADVTGRYPSRIVTSLAFTPDGRRLLGASVGGFVNTWDASTGQQLGRVNTGQRAVQSIAVSPDGTRYATAGDSRTIKLWDTATGQQLAELAGHTASVQVVAFSRDGRLLASAGDDRTIIVWDVATRRPVARLSGHAGRIRGLGFTTDGLVSGGDDGRLIGWTLDVRAAEERICAAGRVLSRAEWAANLGDRPYRPACAAP
ncbi:hypothetical protein AB0K00_51855 [Dactylosporangium sp. NPDC049525]|uniref:nSTAND1 domain-containing NTPase n=1 Tax=Dactylosporangium sp. NPDC049525 TaxID=3154730 RepID=UPI0034186838